ncbi:hypothetical protein ACFC58_41705 [Kitasatospora purpeofusca]|uniref:hypothetical protein n=1 Tax=Kitasatospora purpeofusca TaxID=67352 RepID=UPI0035D78BE9
MGGLRAALAENRSDLDTARQEAARAVRENEDLRHDLRSAETERQQALFLAEQSETVRAAAELARADADFRAAQMSAHTDQAEQAAQAALAWAHRSQTARDAALADAARCQQEATALASAVEELRCILATVSAERDAARAEAARAREQVDRWTSRTLATLTGQPRADSRRPVDPGHQHRPTDDPTRPHKSCPHT